MKNARLVLLCLLLLLSVSGCSKKDRSEQKEGPDEIIRNAENSSFTSSDARDQNLYQSTDVPYTVYEPFIQSHLLSEFETYPMDSILFEPVGPDYFIGQFTAETTLLYSYDYNGDPVDIKRRVVYSSEAELLNSNKDQQILKDAFSESGYGYHDNVLYVQISEDDLFGIESKVNKYTLLKAASSSQYDQYLYYFSIPYKMDADSLDYYNPQKEEESSGEFTVAMIEDLFVNMMNNKKTSKARYQKYFTDDVSQSIIDSFYNRDYPDLKKYEHTECIVIEQKDNIAYAELILYTVPDHYQSGEKIDNYIISGLVKFDPESESCKFAHTDQLWAEMQESCAQKTMTDYGFEALYSGNIAERLWIPFDLDNPFVYQGAMVAKVIEVFQYTDGGFYVTVCFANGTDTDVYIQSIDSLQVYCESGLLFEVASDIDEPLSSNSVMYRIFNIPDEYMQYSSFKKITGAADILLTIES